MAKTKAIRKPIDWHAWGRRLAHLVAELIRRAYAVTVIGVVAWLSYQALSYLVVTLLFPTAAPPQIVGIPTRLNEAVLATRRSDWVGIEVNQNPRVPPAHYHRVDSWIQPDRFNTCARSGCHAPLPHARNKAVRAFLNMHATSVHCGVCHLKTDAHPLAATWYDLRSGQRRGPPTVLTIYAWLMSAEGERTLTQPTAADQERLVSWLRTAAREADNTPALHELATSLEAVRYSSPEFQGLVQTAREMLPRHFRGEYGAKIALLDAAANRPILAHAGTADAVATFLREARTAGPARRAQLVAAVHPQRRERPLHCTDCHEQSDGLIDFAALGYPPARVQMLSRPIIFRMIQNIAEGQPFYMPGFLAPTEPSAATTSPAPARP